LKCSKALFFLLLASSFFFLLLSSSFFFLLVIFVRFHYYFHESGRTLVSHMSFLVVAPFCVAQHTIN